MRNKNIVILLLIPLTAALRTSNFGQNSVFDIFVETNSIENTTDSETTISGAIGITPPPHDQHAKMARFVCHQADWGAMATIAARQPVVGFPFANVFSLSDGPVGDSRGTPYIYATPLEISMHDLKADTRASITMSLAQTSYCRLHQYDPEDPRCAHIILTGAMLTVPTDSEEGRFAAKALFSRHPEMPEWPVDHGWFFTKLNITNILLLDYFGGAITVPVDEYFRATVDAQ